MRRRAEEAHFYAERLASRAFDTPEIPSYESMLMVKPPAEVQSISIPAK